MSDTKKINSVMTIDEDSKKIYGLLINRHTARWNFGKFLLTYFECDFDDFLNIFGSPRTVDSRLNALNNSFPIALRAKLEDGSYIFEKPPFQYTIHMSPKNARYTSLSDTKRYISETVWIPWSFYQLTPVTSFSPDQLPYSFSMFFSDQKISTYDHSYTIAPLPNVFADGKVCLGDSGASLQRDYRDLENKNSIKDIFNIYLNTFYSGGWNSDVLGVIPTMFDYTNFTVLKSAPNYDHLKDIYYKARKAVVPMSHRDPYVRNYINSLKMWSQMSLEDVLLSFNYEIYHNNTRRPVNNSLEKIVTRNDQNYFEYFIHCGGKIMNYPSSFKTKQFYENPIDQSVIYENTEIDESTLYTVLNNLIDYYKDVVNSHHLFN